MRVIGLDLGTHCGYAWTDTGKVVAAQTGAWNFQPKRFEGGGFRYLRFAEALRELTFMHQGEGEACVFFEEVGYHRGADASHVYGAFYGQLQAVCDSAGVAYRGVPISTIKKRATGSGRANKDGMIRAAFHEWGERMTDDQADAAWVLQCGLDELSHTVQSDWEESYA